MKCIYPPIGIRNPTRRVSTLKPPAMVSKSRGATLAACAISPNMGIALELSEVYGGMVTGMIDAFWGTSVIASMLQWHRTVRYVSAPMVTSCS